MFSFLSHDADQKQKKLKCKYGTVMAAPVSKKQWVNTENEEMLHVLPVKNKRQIDTT